MALSSSRSLPDEILRRLEVLPGSRGGLVLFFADVVTAVVCAFLPLADHIGFEFALALTIVNAIFAPAAGASSIRQEHFRSRSERAFGLAAAAAGVYATLLLLFPTGLMLLNGLRRPTCDPGSGLLWMLALPLPTAVLAAATGGVARTLAKTQLGTGVWVAVLEIIPLLLGLSTLYWGPSFFLFDHFFGYFPGPLYDEVVTISWTLLAFRGLTLLWAVVACLLCAALAIDGAGRRANRGITAAVLALALLGISFFAGTRIGFRTTEASLADALGGVRTADGLEIHYPREWTERSVEMVVRDAVFRASQVQHELELSHPAPVKVWMYRSAEEKRRLVGAASTSFSKPWRHEVHVNASPFPHNVLRHELVHAFGAEIGRGPFRVPGGLIPNSPLIEGFAVALDLDTDGLTLAQWAKAMRDLKLAPDVTALFSTWGFMTAAPARAYEYAGAFLRFIDEHYGRAKLLELYSTGDLTRIAPPEELVAEFGKALDATGLTPAERATAQRHLARPSVFRRRCAREVSAIADEAQELMSEGRTQDSLAAYSRVCDMEPDDPAMLQSLLRAALQANNTALRDATTARLLNHPKADPTLRASVLMDLGDDLWRHNALTEAGDRFREAAAIPVDAGIHRTVLVKEYAMQDPTVAALLEPLLVENNADVRELFALNDYVVSHPSDRVVSYLLARQFVQRNAVARGVALLDRADSRLLASSEFAKEIARLLVRGNAELQRCPEAEVARGRLVEAGGGAADQAVAQDWVDRCRFGTAKGWAALADTE